MPFRGIISRDHGVPWPEVGMTTARWIAEVPVQVVRIRDLIATQPGVLLHALTEDHQRGEQPHELDPHVHVIDWGGNLFLEDGHHRAMRAMLRGDAHMAARVLRLPA